GASGKGRNQAELPRQGMHGPDASVSHAVGTRRNLVMDVAGGEHRSGATTDVALVKAALDAPLAVVQPPPYDDIHSKSLVGPGSREPVQLLKPRKTPKDFELSEIPPPLVADGSAYLGARLGALGPLTTTQTNGAWPLPRTRAVTGPAAVKDAGIFSPGDRCGPAHGRTRRCDTP